MDLDALLDGLTLAKLNQEFSGCDEKAGRDQIDPLRSKFGKIEKEEVTLPEKLDFVEGYARQHKKFSFRSLLKTQSSKTQIVVTFLAILEMMKTGKIRIEQEQPFEDIMITSMMEQGLGRKQKVEINRFRGDYRSDSFLQWGVAGGNKQDCGGNRT